MTSQILAIFYLNDLDHYIKEQLHIKYYVRYQDDFILFHADKRYLKECLVKITKFLEKEKLILNQKTRLFKSNDSVVYLGRKKNGSYANYLRSMKHLKRNYKLYNKKIITLLQLLSSIQSYHSIIKKQL